MEAVLCLTISAYSPIYSLNLAVNTFRFIVGRCFYALQHSTHPATDPDLRPSDAPVAEAAARAGFDCSNWCVFRITLPAERHVLVANASSLPLQLSHYPHLLLRSTLENNMLTLKNS